MDAAAFRARFPVLDRMAYLNAGSCGPIPAEAAIAARAALASALHEGRGSSHFEARAALQQQLREGYARVIGADARDVALTTSASEGLGKVLAGLRLRPGDEVLTSDEEHPGLTGPLIALRETGVVVRAAPWTELVESAGPNTTVIAVSHVSWLTGAIAPVKELAATGVPVVLDGAQGAGAVPTDVREIGCAAYACAGQKWLCGADGTGFLYVAPSLLENLAAVAPGYTAMADPAAGLDAPLHPDARRYDTPAISRESAALSLAALGVLESFGLAAASDRAATLAETLAAELETRGRTVAPRGPSTLVSWKDPDPQTTVERARQHGVLIRNLPATSYVRASVGAWNDPSDLDRLLEAIG